MIIRKMTPMDSEEVTEIHLKSFQGFFLSFLGDSFLNVFYQSICLDQSGVALVIEESGKTLGFVVGSIQPSGFYSRLIKKSWYRFVFASIGAILRKPKIIPKLFRAVYKPNEALPAENCATLMSIAIDPITQGQGYGKKLISQFIEEVKQAGCSSVNLTTDSLNNKAVNHFYCNVGFGLIREFSTPEGRKMNEYLYHI